MLFLVFLPLLMLFVPTNIPGVLFGFLLYILICYGMNRYCKSCNLTISFRLKNVACLVVVSAILGCMFYKRWLPSEKVLAIASILNMQVSLFLGLVSGALSIMAVWSLNALAPIVNRWKQEEASYYISRGQRGKCREEVSWTSYLILLLMAVTAMTICSKSSPIYPFNDWVDSNAFFSVGKSMLNGAVPYRDLFEHKGPLLYMLHAFAAMISYDSFLGMYFVEILCCFAFLIMCFYLLRLYIDSDKEVMFTLSIATVFIYTSKAFYYGDSAEELCMPLLAYGLWVSIKALRQSELPSAKDGFWIGITSACVLWIKFNILGFYIGWIIVPAYLAFKSKQIKKLAILIGSIILGVVVVTVPIVIYFGVNHAIADWLQVYFYNNLFSYTTTRSEVAVFAIVSNLLDGLLVFETISFIVFVLSIAGIVWCSVCENKTILYHYIFTLLFTFLFTYIGGRYFYYYAMIFGVFVIWGTVWLTDIYKRFISTQIEKVKYKMGVLWAVVFAILLFVLSPNTDMLKYDKSELAHFQIKEEIEKSGKENPTLLNYGCLDVGIYTVCGIQPTCRYFHSTNLTLPEIEEEQAHFIENGLVDFIVTTEAKVDFELYDLIGDYEYNSEEIPQILYLYQLKE